MNDEIRELKKRIAELEAENAALKAQSKNELQYIVDPKAKQILKYLFDNPRNFTAAQIAAHCGIPKSVSQTRLAVASRFHAVPSAGTALGAPTIAVTRAAQASSSG